VAVQDSHHGIAPCFCTQEWISSQTFCLFGWLACFDDQRPDMDTLIDTFQCLVAECFQSKARSSLPSCLSGVTGGQIGINVSSVMT
jgi:hypothetical protein